MHEADLVLQYPETIAKAIANALLPEAADGQVPKTRAEVVAAQGELRVHIRADDLSALRAALNSYTRWIEAAERAARIGRA